MTSQKKSLKFQFFNIGILHFKIVNYEKFGQNDKIKQFQFGKIRMRVLVALKITSLVFFHIAEIPLTFEIRK